MPFRVYIHYEEGGEDDHMTLKLGLPKKWVTGPSENLKTTFVDNYNKKHPETPLDCATCHLVNKKGKAIPSEAPCDVYLEHKDDVKVKPGPSPAYDAEEVASAQEAKEKAAAAPTLAASPTAAAAAATSNAHEGMLRCKNYSCQSWYKPEENPEGSCRHHVAPPIFHETKKGWSCCKDKMVYDWDDFMAIKGCTTGQHSNVDPKVTFAQSPTLAAAAAANVAAAAAPAAAKAPAPKVRSIDTWNEANPDAANAAASAAKTLNSKPKPKPRRDDGTAKCIRKGCNKDFVLAENSATACSYHVQNPVFHDRSKFWACCPHKVVQDFDSFLAIPGCATGSHDDGYEEE